MEQCTKCFHTYLKAFWERYPNLTFFVCPHFDCLTNSVNVLLTLFIWSPTPFLPSLPPPTVLLKQDYTFRNLSWKPFIILQAILLLIFCIMKYYWWSSNKFLQANNLSCLEIIINLVYSSHSSLNLMMCSHFYRPLLMAGTSDYMKRARAVAWISSASHIFNGHSVFYQMSYYHATWPEI